MTLKEKTFVGMRFCLRHSYRKNLADRNFVEVKLEDAQISTFFKCNDNANKLSNVSDKWNDMLMTVVECCKLNAFGPKFLPIQAVGLGNLAFLFH